MQLLLRSDYQKKKYYRIVPNTDSAVNDGTRAPSNIAAAIVITSFTIKRMTSG
ncbi:MAG: hypothetical protein ABSE82_03810 [Nitrososphaerales archaeon]